MRVVIVGAGHAGGSAAAFLRQFGFGGEIILIGDEPVAPYQRPPLSKAWLKGEADAESLKLKDDGFYPQSDIDLRLNMLVEHVDLSRKTVSVGGQALCWDKLIIAAGSKPRRLSLPGADHPALMELRTAADADRLKAALRPGAKLVIVGAGYVGLEVAASARALGCDVVVIEREDRVLARVASEPLSAFFERVHRERGVELTTGAETVGFEDGRAVRLADGRVFAGDAALVGVGAVARDDLAAAAGLRCDGGIVVDLEARTSHADVHAIGDCTRRPLPLYETTARLESVPNALEQARQAAAAIAGAPPPAPEVPWFWSDQYAFKLQIAGLPFDVDEIVVRGDPKSGRFAVFHLGGGTVKAVEAVNAPPEFMMGRQLIARRSAIDAAKLADLAVSMKDVAA